jgi:phosphomannomutase
MVTINIAEEFAAEPGARTYDDGPKSGQEFFDDLLRPRFAEALNKKEKLKVILDGVEGYASSFLNEAFRRLGNEFGPDIVMENLLIISNEIPKYARKIKESVYEKG